jgi:preprotein translocase subunit SecG
LQDAVVEDTFSLLMNFLFWALIIIHVLGCLILIGLVLIQNDKAGGIGGAFGGVSGNQAFTSAGAATFVSKLTKWWAMGLIVVVLLINLLVSRLHVGRGEESSAIKQAIQTEGAAKVLRDLGAPQEAPVPGVMPGVPGVPGVPAAPAK